MSINRGDRKHPFPPELLQRMRQHIAQAIGLNLHTTKEVAPGQPFYQPYLSTGGGWRGCRCTLPQGHCHRCAPGGHHTYMDITRHMANKDELKGESPLWEDLPMGRDNYSSARDFSSQVRQAFKVDMGWKAHSPKKKQPSDVAALQPNSAQGLWQPLTKATKSARSMTAVGVMPTPTSNRTPWKRQLLPLSWTASRPSIG